jgi:hypothetical protein
MQPSVGHASAVFCLPQYSTDNLLLVAAGACYMCPSPTLPPCRRQIHGESEHDVAVPPLVKTALVWGLFMGVSSNLRYQVGRAATTQAQLQQPQQIAAVFCRATNAFYQSREV